MREIAGSEVWRIVVNVAVVVEIVVVVNIVVDF